MKKKQNFNQGNKKFNLLDKTKLLNIRGGGSNDPPGEGGSGGGG